MYKFQEWIYVGWFQIMAASFSSESGVETDLEVDKKHDGKNRKLN